MKYLYVLQVCLTCFRIPLYEISNLFQLPTTDTIRKGSKAKRVSWL